MLCMKKTRDSIAERSGTVVRYIPQLGEFTNSIDEHLTTGRSGFFYPRDEQEFNQLVELVGHTDFDASLVLGYSLVDTSKRDSMGEALQIAPELKGKTTMWTLLNWLGDFTSNAEFPSNFMAKAVIKLDDETSMYYEYESTTYAVMCEECQQLDPEDEDNELSDLYSCEHCLDGESSRFHAAILKTPDADTLEKVLVFGF